MNTTGWYPLLLLIGHDVVRIAEAGKVSCQVTLGVGDHRFIIEDFAQIEDLQARTGGFRANIGVSV
jgi:hypothetical protein